MTLSSMTGFARSHGASGSYAWSWEIKSVNAKGLELRLRLPSGFDAVEVPVRTRGAEMLSRGNVYATLTVNREGIAPVVRINEPVLNAIIDAAGKLSKTVDAEKPRIDGLLGLKGVIDVTDAEESEEEKAAVEDAVIKGFVQALKGLTEMRRHEGEAIGRVLSARLDEMAALAARADAAPGRQPEAVKKKLAEQVAVLLEASNRFDPDRLHQEAVLLAGKADIREELDRLAAHIAQARKLMNGGGAIGRRLDFLSQELNRETNTLCAKSNDVELTNIGLELKSVVEQFREQVQNLE
ncbi:YicC/YloC family endoribonuclease [Pseudorhodoplanes sp.]|uniref:YicC/YloC family endoribonuclease n=1 Tax=Pseudorhodoplanes sp. TaxID=1934341 RepID=UPI002CEEFBC0|nr:YicC/YloC family endoribonuclease [Pseudorhodoplanes sp.]HWV52252.1 YicC/YloC family endoribonuclease [Pseudorhodoplanes sp.]